MPRLRFAPPPSSSRGPTSLRAFVRIRRGLPLVALWSTTACSGEGPSGPDPQSESPTPIVTSLSPAVLVEGFSFVIEGSDFGTTPTANVVTVDGISATVTAATATRLTVTAPTFDCRPQRTVEVRVRRADRTSQPAATLLQPPAVLELPVGEMVVIDDPAAFCLQFPPAHLGSGEYLVGIGSASEQPGSPLAVSMIGEKGQPAPILSASGAAIPGGVGAARTPPSIDPRSPDPWEARGRAEARLRRMEREILSRARTAPRVTDANRASISRTSAVARTPVVGEEMEIRVPTLDADTPEGLCTPIPITTRVRVVGERVIIVTDVDNPAADPLTDDDLQSFADAFDDYVYDTDVEYFGEPLDLDGNGRLIVALTVEMNRVSGGVGGVVFLPDLLDPTIVDPSFCPAASGREIYYHAVPDPADAGGSGPATKAEVVESFLPILSHEFAHILQHSVRLRLTSPIAFVPMQGWEAEGQAMLATEVVAHVVRGNLAGRNYGAATALSVEGSAWWYRETFERLARYYGFEGAGGRRPDATRTCSLFGGEDCGRELYGARWSFLRYLTDRYGPGWPGGEPGFMRDWIGRNLTMAGTANVEALLNRPFHEVFAEWAAMHYLDAHVPGADPDLLMPSWDLGDILPALSPDATLQPTPRVFADFSAAFSIVGGGTDYSLFTDAAARPATAIRFRTPDGAVLDTSRRPTLWVVRTR